MKTSEMLTPDEIISFSEAFANSLTLLNKTFDQQCVNITTNAIHTVAASHSFKEEITEDKKQTNSADVLASTTTDKPEKLIAQLEKHKSVMPIPSALANTSTETNGSDIAKANSAFYTGLLDALVTSYHNAVTAQQQAYITAQAATTSGIATLYSIDTASTGKAI